MADKDKIKGWTLYQRKLWRWLVSTEIRVFFIIESAVVLMGAITGVIIWCSKGFTTLSDGLEFFRVLITIMIAVGGGYGLILAARRAVKFSEQVETGQKQLFNEQLGRGAELLANGEVVMRQTGIRVLEDLAETTINQGLSKENIKQAQLIMRIIHDFVHADTNTPLKGNEDSGARIAKGRERLDIALGIRTLASLYNESGKQDDFKELVQFQACRLEGLIFNGAELQGVDFSYAKLQGAHFWLAKLQGANLNYAQLQGANFNQAQLQDARFWIAQLQGADFNQANLQWANFKIAKLQGADFSYAQLQGASFSYAQLQKASFMGAQLQGANFSYAKLQGADFKGANLQWVDCTGADFLGAKGLMQEHINGMIFEDKYSPKLPKIFKDDLDPKCGYEWKKDQNDKFNRRRFVKSKAEWSGKWVDEYLAEIGIHNPKDDG